MRIEQLTYLSTQHDHARLPKILHVLFDNRSDLTIACKLPSSVPFHVKYFLVCQMFIFIGVLILDSSAVDNYEP